MFIQLRVTTPLEPHVSLSQLTTKAVATDFILHVAVPGIKGKMWLSDDALRDDLTHIMCMVTFILFEHPQGDRIVLYPSLGISQFCVMLKLVAPATNKTCSNPVD